MNAKWAVVLHSKSTTIHLQPSIDYPTTYTTVFTMSKVSVTDSSLWFEWDDATLKRKAYATESDNAQDYADRHAARDIRKGRKEWSSEEVMKKSNASRYDYENYGDKNVARAIIKRDRNDASKEAHEKAETAMANLSIDGPPKLPNDRGTASKDATDYDNLRRGKEPQKRKPSVPLVASQPSSGSGSRPRTDNAGVQGREGRSSAREKGKRNRSASASRTRDPAKKPSTASSSNSGKPPTANSSNSGKPPTASSSNSGKPPTASSSNSGKPPTASSSNSGKPPTANSSNSGKPPTASSSNSGKPHTASSSNSDKPPTASSSNPTGGTEPEPRADYPYTQNKEGRYICPEKGCETKSYSERFRFRSHYDTIHTGRAKLYYCELGHECREEPFDRHDSYLKHLRSVRHQRKQAEHNK
ncbi:uncharacterized protein EAE98_010264 [Botrytis deweyae]|uniref:C2H2-type domain-containing protein n=1 Tax=Botrytis deweyae TaxID=2478750 RepID=A0ABQ7I910_9HELO|nr:uncharacterized protein EAE98_010264 [Botrytis deweyae]KAF7917159.1 hypothetical protein EAE98_010264 [Botrytis deweyae]